MKGSRIWLSRLLGLTAAKLIHYTMSLRVLSGVLVGIAVMGASCKHVPTTEANRDWLYLGIPADEDYPRTTFHLKDSVAREKYWRVSKVQHVSKEEYERDLSAGRALFRDQHSGIQFYSTELRHHINDHVDTWYWVMILERKAYP
jgi:hypothetical protein